LQPERFADDRFGNPDRRLALLGAGGTMPNGFVARRHDGEKVWLFHQKKQDPRSRVRDVRWGDFLSIDEQTPDGWSTIRWGRERHFIRTENIAETRPLEVMFVDVGQGDGCIVVSPETGGAERILIVDAGLDDNMLRLVKWRFGKLNKRFRFHAAIVTHPDQDHYSGFQFLFNNENALFDRVYHNGITERATGDLFGASDASGRFLINIAESDDDIRRLYADAAVRGNKRYPKLIATALGSGRVGKVEMLSTEHGTKEGGKCWMPQFAPSDGRATTIQVLGPIPEVAPGGKARLRWFGPAIGSTARNEAKTKNGHSVLLRISIGKLRLLLGGDLNQPAEDYLLRRYSGVRDDQPLSDAVAAASAHLSADVLKSCHHGSADVTDEFLQAVGPFAFVVSSGDEESHAHPRPDLLGRLGKQGRGAAPLVLCTEILRSTREKGRAEDFNKLRALDRQIDDPRTPDADRKEARKQRTLLQQHIQRRNVGVYGAISMRSDGMHMEISFRLEKARDKQLWQSYALRHDAGQGWTMVDTAGH
jgi:beta-lactamase superfamily II metal-dependent hydrolase